MGFNIFDTFGIAKTEEERRKEYKDIVIDYQDIVITHHNKYSMEELQEMAAGIELTGGIQEPLILGKVNGELWLGSGHRRWSGIDILVKEGKEQYRQVPCRYKEMTETEFRLELLIGNTFNRKKSDYDKMMEAAEWKEVLTQARKEKLLVLEEGERVRDYVAAILGESTGKIGTLEAINNHATAEVKEQMAAGTINTATAHEISKLPEEQQKEIVQEIEESKAAGTDLKAEEIQRMTEEKKKNVSDSDTNEKHRAGDDYETPHPEGITSLCYSCTGYETCNVKTGTCTKCDQYHNRAETYKSEEQRYSEEQDRIDRETAKKLRDRADEEKMNNIPSVIQENTPRVHQIKVGTTLFEDIESGKKNFTIRKNDRGYKAGDILEKMEFIDGSYTGRSIRLFVTYMIEDFTGLEDGYCIMGTSLVNEDDKPLVGADIERICRDIKANSDAFDEAPSEDYIATEIAIAIIRGRGID